MAKVSVTVDTLDLRLCLGIACSLGALLCSLTGKISEFTGIDYSSSASFFATGVAALALLALTPLFARRRARVALAVADVALAGCWAGLGCAAMTLGLAGEPALAVLFGSAGKVCAMILTVQWNYHIACCSESRNVPVVISAIALGALLYLALAAAGGLVATAGVFALTLLGAALCLSVDRDPRSYEELSGEGSPAQAGAMLPARAGGKSASQPGAAPHAGPGGEAPSRLDEPAPDPRALRGVRARFFGSRLAWGVALGVLLGISAGTGSPVIGGPLPVAAVALALLAVAVIVRATAGSMPAVTAALYPLVVYVLLIAAFEPVLSSGGRLFVGAAMLPRFVQTWTQLPSYRRVVRMDAAPFAYFERLLTFVTFEFLSSGVMRLTAGLDHASASYVGFVGWYSLALTAVTAAAMCRHFYRYYPLHGLGGPQPVVAQGAAGTERALATARGRYALSARELEVFQLLAEGYSRPYIEKRLCISTGTAKTHIRRVYGKLGVGSQDELIELAHGLSREPARA